MLNIVIEKRVSMIPEAGCWIWMGCINKQTGYGDLTYQYRRLSAHRAAWEAFNGPIPEGMHVLHRCDVRACCNPHHLFLGTNNGNIADSMRKGRHIKERPSRKGIVYNFTKKPGPKPKVKPC